MTRVLRLDDRRATDVQLSGPKMATLARLRAARFTVPNGFIITTECGPLEDAEVEAALMRAYDDLGRDVPVSVRSSAATEDTAQRSAAGMYTTVLDVAGLAEVCEAFTTCRASARSEHVRAYLDGNADVRLAVGVMEMVDPAISGVTFTRWPAGSSSMYLELVSGSLAKLVNGAVIPEHLALHRETGEVLQHDLGEHGRPLLDHAQLSRVRAICLQIAELLGHDCDIEWALVEDRVTILQARPITA